MDYYGEVKEVGPQRSRQNDRWGAKKWLVARMLRGSQVLKLGKQRYMRISYDDGDEGWYFYTASSFLAEPPLIRDKRAPLFAARCPQARHPGVLMPRATTGVLILPRATKRSGLSARNLVRALRS